ncbi:MAG: bifunctional 4-hydroxy-2-oxoglutarate aldolase/2-dehydro-3-deoxy-phosphogluconate aldolase [Christensenellales bacterium]
MKIFDTLSRIGIVPVIKIEDARDAAPLCAALQRGGIPAAEITFRTDAAEQALRNARAALPDILLGAGTVLTVEQAKRAVDAGASFIVSPGLNPEVVSHCVKNGIPVLPGCATPSDIERTIGLGLHAVKFFPAEAMGGIKTVRAISAPYGGISFVPTGGITRENMGEYLAFPKVMAVGGSWMVPTDAVKAKDWDKIERLTRDAVDAMLGFSICGMGMYFASEEEVRRAAESFSKMLGWKFCDAGNARFSGDDGLDLTWAPTKGKAGYISIGTNDLRRAVFAMEKRGFSVDTEKSGNTAVFLQEEFAGFAVQLIKK